MRTQPSQEARNRARRFMGIMEESALYAPTGRREELFASELEEYAQIVLKRYQHEQNSKEETPKGR